MSKIYVKPCVCFFESQNHRCCLFCSMSLCLCFFCLFLLICFAFPKYNLYNPEVQNDGKLSSFLRSDFNNGQLASCCGFEGS